MDDFNIFFDLLSIYPWLQAEYRAHASLTSLEPQIRVLLLRRPRYQKSYFEANMSLIRVHIFTLCLFRDTVPDNEMITYRENDNYEKTEKLIRFAHTQSYVQ